MCQFLIHLKVLVFIKDKRNKEYVAQIEEFTQTDLTRVSEDWKFNWKQLYTAYAKFFMITYEGQIQGMIKLEEENELYYVLKNVEVAPWNLGSEGEFKNVADILISYACLKSFELNMESYKGFLVFTSKGTLIEYYQNKYKAELIFRERMIINPKMGKQLITTHLKIDLDHDESTL